MSMGTKMQTSGKNILIFAPYGAWTVHHQVDAVLGAALQLRGCEVRALVCDGFFESCPIANGDRSCAECFRTARDLFSSFGLPVVQLRSLIRTDDLSECRVWLKVHPKRVFSVYFSRNLVGLPSGFTAQTIHSHADHLCAGQWHRSKPQRNGPERRARPEHDVIGVRCQ